MNNLLSQLNNVLSQWAEVFDLLSQICLAFLVDPQAFLCLNDTQLCPANQKALNYASYDAEQITFYFEDFSEVRITIAWPEEASPFVSDINFNAA